MWSKAAPVAARFLVAGVMLAGWGVSAGVAGADPEPAPSPSPSPAPAPSPSPAPAAKTTMDHDGTFAVGTDIAPGTYSSAGPVGDRTCYWKRLGNPDGNLIDNALTKKPQVVQIDPTDKSFKTSGCQPWQLTPDATPPADTPSPAVQGTLGILNGLLGGPNGQQAPHP
ncbi:MAG: hypothetical protein JOZ23_01410 [Mycobacterium sp.]|nr:hypothetical protein [Mycobacterium sp.]